MIGERFSLTALQYGPIHAAGTVLDARPNAMRVVLKFPPRIEGDLHDPFDLGLAQLICGAAILGECPSGSPSVVMTLSAAPYRWRDREILLSLTY